jgi:hypothetical protein
MHATTNEAGRQPKPPEPVAVRGTFAGGAARQDLLDGSAVLSVTDLGTGAEQAYWCEAAFRGETCVGVRLWKFGGGRRYEVPGDLSACTCADRTHRPERPGGCRHMAALRQALPAVTKASA